MGATFTQIHNGVAESLGEGDKLGADFDFPSMYFEEGTRDTPGKADTEADFEANSALGRC